MNTIILVLCIVNFLVLIVVGCLLFIVLKHLPVTRYWIRIDRIGIWFLKGWGGGHSGTCFFEWPWRKGWNE